MKTLIRKKIKENFKNLTQNVYINNCKIIQKKLLNLTLIKKAKIIGIYFAKEKEVDTKQIIINLIKKNKKIALPLIKNNNLEFKIIKSTKDLELGKFKILEPQKHCQSISPKELEVLIMPCISIDKNGNRIGRGKGFFDRFLEKNNILNTICIAHNFQLISHIPKEIHDQKVNLIITEKQIIKMKKDPKILDGKKLSKKILAKLKKKIEKEKIKAKLAVILIGNNPASEIYVKKKKESCKKIGINFQLKRFTENISLNKLKKKIIELNNDKNTTGILIQLPLPKHLDTQKILNFIDPIKDVDGLTSHNQKLCERGIEYMSCCTPKGILRLLEENKISLKNKKIVNVGYGKLVGKPLSILMKNRKLNFSVCNKKTQNLQQETKKADIIISAVGIPNLITKDHIKKNSIIIDAGTSKKNNKIVGDVKSDVKKIASKITPVPGGVGPMTIAMLLENVIKAYKRQNESN